MPASPIPDAGTKTLCPHEACVVHCGYVPGCRARGILPCFPSSPCFSCMFELHTYLTDTGHSIFMEWFSTLRDTKVKKAILRRLERLRLGHFGDCKPIADGVWELRIDLGAGWRLYYAISGKHIVLLLCGGTKASQREDTARACAYWQDWQLKEKKELQ